MRSPHLRLRSTLVPAALVALALLVGACSSGEAPEVPAADGEPDPVLVEGREIWSSQCARCHKADGSGGAGVKLDDGRAEELHPQVGTMIEVVTEGRNAMPSFGGSLSAEEIEAVVRYVREVL